jgi:hypothetical protein
MFRRYDSHWRRQCFRYHAVFGWWHIPNLTARLGLGQTFHVFRTNAEGMRADRDYPRKRPEGRRRLVVLGDSYAAGDGVSNGLRMSDHLEQRYAHLDAMNFAVNGTGTDQQLLIYEDLARYYEADGYLWLLCVENIARNLYHGFPSYDYAEQRARLRPKPYFDLSDGTLVLRNVPVPRDSRPLDAPGDWAYGFPHLPDVPDDPYAIYRYPERLHWRLMKAIIRRLLDQVAGKPVFLVPLPMVQHYLDETPPRYLERFHELEDPSHDVHVIDVLPALRARPIAQRQHYRFPDDPHYTAYAHALIADCLEYQIKRLCPWLLHAAPAAAGA